MTCLIGLPQCPGPEGSGAKCAFCKNKSIGSGLSSTSPVPSLKPVSLRPLPSTQSAPPISPVPSLKPVSLRPLPSTPSAPFIPTTSQTILPTLPAVQSTSPGTTAGIVLYRGDTRAPDVIKGAGFTLWGEAMANVSKARGIGNYLRDKCGELKNGRTFADWIRIAKSRARPTISTSRNDGCGGYDDGYIYRIEFSGLTEYTLDTPILPPGAPMTWTSNGLKAHMDQGLTTNAQTIVVDLKLKTEEWAFFTAIPAANIKSYLPAKEMSDFRKGLKQFLPM